MLKSSISPTTSHLRARGTNVSLWLLVRLLAEFVRLEALHTSFLFSHLPAIPVSFSCFQYLLRTQRRR